MNCEFVICEDCKGSGFVAAGMSGISQTCPTCWGAGKLTWVERVVGKQHPKSEGLTGPTGFSGWIGGSSYSVKDTPGLGLTGNDYYLTDKFEIIDKKKPKNSVDKFVIIAKKVLKDLVNDYGIIFKLMF